MNDHQRLAVHAAARVRQSMTTMHSGHPSLGLPETAWLQCNRLVRQIDKAVQRGWHQAARRLRRELGCAIGTCRRRLEQVAGELQGDEPRQELPTQRELFQELIALENEFDEVRLERKSPLSVVTEPVILDGVDLGRFEIILEADWDPRRTWGSYDVIALDPNPAASSSDTTHPHVQGDQLCEGDGRSAVRCALREGRLFDFFVLVRQILHTYNPGSAYVSLERWTGIECRDCGSLVGEDDRSFCEPCEVDICCNCSSGCAACGRSCCSECVETCSGCGDYFCSRCLELCTGCREPFCQECLTDEKCSSCRKGNEKEGEEPEKQAAIPSSVETESARTPLQPVRVGEAPVPAGS
jgi:hypothetical protein